MEKHEGKQKQITTNNCQLMTAKQLGLLLALSKRQVFRLNSCGKIPKPIRIGGSVRWSTDTIFEWISMDCPDRREWEQRRKAEGSTNAY